MEKRDTILMVEDEQASLRVLSGIQEHDCCCIQAAEDGSQPFSLVDQNFIGLIPHDAMIPKASGYNMDVFDPVFDEILDIIKAQFSLTDVKV